MNRRKDAATKTKIKILPDGALSDKDWRNQEVGREVYSQLNLISDSTARRDAERFGRAERDKLPRVAAFCTATSYDIDSIFQFLGSRKKFNHAAPRRIDECVYSPYVYQPSLHDVNTGKLIPVEGIESFGPPEVFMFDYGVTVIWGMTMVEERRFLKEIERFSIELLPTEDIESEIFNFYVTKDYQPRIYDDLITLREGSNYMVKLAISHAIAQSVKISLFEELVDGTIETTKDIPQMVAESGKVHMSRKQIMMNVGELFILRININLVGSVLDSPELCWSEPQLEPVYQAARQYLEINQRVSLLNQRMDVIGDLLQMLKEQISVSHSEYLEWIVIILIATEILIAVVNIIVDVAASG